MEGKKRGKVGIKKMKKKVQNKKKTEKKEKIKWKT